MDTEALQNQLSTAAGQTQFLHDKLIRPLEERYGVKFGTDPTLSALTRALEENPDLTALRAAFENSPDLNNMFPDISDPDLAALQEMFRGGRLPADLQAIMDALARLNADRAAGVGGNFDQDA